MPSCLLPIHLSHEKLTVYLYETAPVKKVTGYFICNGVARVAFSEPPFEGAEICDEAKKIIKEGCVPLEELKKYKGKKKCTVRYESFLSAQVHVQADGN